MEEHDYDRYPELTNKQLAEYGFSSPHKQITEDFYANVIKVVDGDTIRVECDFRDFNFPIRFLGIDAPEMSEGGEEAREWLKSRILGEEIEVKIDKRQRVGKYGRLLGQIHHMGMDIGEVMRQLCLVISFDQRNEGKLPELTKTFRIKQWL